MSIRYDLSGKIIEACKGMNQSGLNQGTAGNISCRFDNGMLITPSGIAYDQMEENDIVFVSNDGTYDNNKVPSSEWRFHQIIYQTRPDLNAVVHNHAQFSTTLSILNKAIPAIHYMIAAAGGKDIPCIPYATYGTPELSDHVATGFAERNAILMQHHGMTAAGETLAKAVWLAEEVETLSKLYTNLLQTGLEIPTLSDDEIAVVLGKFKHYGLREKS
ncbi:fuculose phosphate aldolase [Endozoicomonas montiporae]|uniref:Fuculose phosphate aldolase n=2 Tax=Endozoicomonas montiporae TaxID=1027273 RepID=A0A081MZ75_9GAMM|nr:L-fuculose-phosphate aldolase [Endozoicomonas montiporae]AMO54970.1 L-fuculose phosphate aldolase [Endozoicomonas montiporae CL-33]KEQ11498.1 fuculose phosphate aldolase [Endozoicomonas montiporae]